MASRIELNLKHSLLVIDNLLETTILRGGGFIAYNTFLIVDLLAFLALGIDCGKSACIYNLVEFVRIVLS